MVLCLVLVALSQAVCAGNAQVSPGSAPSSALKAADLSAADQVAAAAAVATFFRQCEEVTGTISTKASNCPQQIDPGRCWFYAQFCVLDSFRWKLVGDPSTDLVYGIAAAGKIRAIGHYLMTVSFSAAYPNSPKGVYHDVSGGPFAAILQQAGSAFSVTDLTSGKDANGALLVKAPRLKDPGDHTAVLAAVKAFFAVCAAATTSMGAPDCPARLSSYCREALTTVWSMKGDPTAGANVTWDDAYGYYSIFGSYQFHALASCSGAPPYSREVGGHYWAYAVWSNGQPQVILIGGETN
jgi:hypothetical protein